MRRGPGAGASLAAHVRAVENGFVFAHAGSATRICVKPGEMVAADAILMDLAPLPAHTAGHV
jgi:hypothetical protein